MSASMMGFHASSRLRVSSDTTSAWFSGTLAGKIIGAWSPLALKAPLRGRRPPRGLHTADHCPQAAKCLATAGPADLNVRADRRPLWTLRRRNRHDKQRAIDGASCLGERLGEREVGVECAA